MTGSNHETKLDEVYGEDRPIKASELQSVLEETEKILGALKDTINVHAEILYAHRWILEKFVPAPLLKQAYTEYYESRKKAIEMESAVESLDADPEKAN